MGFLSNLFGRSVPQAQTPPQITKPQVQQASTTQSTQRPRQINDYFRGYYEALNQSDDRTSVPFYVPAMRQSVRARNRQRLASLGDYFYDNDWMVGYAVDTIANYSVPILPVAASPNKEWNALANDWFCEWGKKADFSGRFTFGDLQRQMCKYIDLHGEISAVMTEDSGFPQIQLLETYFIGPSVLGGQSATPGEVDGVLLTPKGVVKGFRLNTSKDQPPQTISANEMIMLYDGDRYTDYRGYSPIRRGINDHRDGKDIKGFEKIATKIASALAGVLEDSEGEEENEWGEEESTPGTNDTGDAPPVDATQRELSISKAELLGGDIKVLPKGKKLNIIDNNRPGERVLEMIEFLSGCFVAGLGLPPEFLVHQKNTGPGERSVNGKAQRKFNHRQELMAKFAAEWVWVRAVGWGIANGQLPAQDGWQKTEWQGPPKVSIDEGKDAASWREDQGKGLMTREEYYANRARNWQRETDQVFAEDDYILTRAQSQSTTYGVPIELILNRWGWGAAKPPQQTKSPNEAPPTTTN